MTRMEANCGPDDGRTALPQSHSLPAPEEEAHTLTDTEEEEVHPKATFMAHAGYAPAPASHHIPARREVIAHALGDQFVEAEQEALKMGRTKRNRPTSQALRAAVSANPVWCRRVRLAHLADTRRRVEQALLDESGAASDAFRDAAANGVNPVAMEP